MSSKIVLLTLVVISVNVAGENEFDDGNLGFSIEFFKHVSSRSSNSVVSPISVRLALAAIQQAAGSTLSERIKDAINLSTNDKQKTADDAREFLASVYNEQLRILFNVFRKNESLNPTFEESLREVFGSGIEAVDFHDRGSVSQKINQWVSNATNKFIDEYVEEDTVDPQTELMLINAVTLRARWASKFRKAKTKTMMFHFLDGDREIEVMSQAMSVPYRVAEDYHAAELLFSEESDLSMWIILPRGRGSVRELVRILSPGLIESIRIGCKTTSLMVELPRFSIKNEFNVTDVLKKMGYENLFGVFDLEMFHRRQSEFADILQTTVVSVDEDGTEASTATRLNVKWRVGSRPFFAHRPFIFYIQKRSTNTVLFIGQYSNHED
ncbi:neuroserpin-like [Toxorhynchites rutilus septentrionalis]|uniref:neuroserpin-like n=1 Tax=Toxorhynchites rutilus septentrionalis TaxID=329112 RepID=UPI002478DF76|nr:neuroserpin-like [Toxorhynchites rutilus septentrionalis]